MKYLVYCITLITSLVLNTITLLSFNRKHATHVKSGIQINGVQVDGVQVDVTDCDKIKKRVKMTPSPRNCVHNCDQALIRLHCNGKCMLWWFIFNDVYSSKEL